MKIPLSSPVLGLFGLLLAAGLLVAVPNVAEPAGEGAESSDGDRRFYALALLQSARLHLAKGELNQGKAFLSRAFQVDPAVDTLEARALDMAYPDFPQVDLPETGYRYGPARFSRDGRHFVYAQDAEWKHFDAGNLEVVSLGALGTSRPHLEVSASGRHLVAAGQDATFALYDLKAGHLLHRLALWGTEGGRTSGAVPVMAFSEDEEEVAIFHEEATEGAIQFRPAADFGTATETLPIGRRVYSFVYAPRPGRMLVGEHDRVTLRDRLTREVLRSWPASGRVFSLALSPDGRRLAAGGWREVHVYDLESGDLVGRFQACVHNVTDVGFLAGGRVVAWSSPAFRSGLFDVRSGRRIQDFPFGGTMSLNAERRLMAVGDRFVDLTRLAELTELDDPGMVLVPGGPSPPADVPRAVEEELRGLGRHGVLREAWRSHGRSAYVTRGGHVLVARSAKKVEVLSSDYRITAALGFLDGPERLLRLGVAGNGMFGVLEVFDLGTGDRRQKPMRDPPESLALSADDRFAAVVDRAGRLWLFATDDVERPALLLERTDEGREARFSADGEALAVRTGDRWRRFDLRRLEHRQLPGEMSYGFRIEGVELRSDG